MSNKQCLTKRHKCLCHFLGVTYRGSHYIQPELSQSQLSFSDLFLDPDTGRVRCSLCVCVCVLFSVSAINKDIFSQICHTAEHPVMNKPILSCRFVLGKSGRVFVSLCGAARWFLPLGSEFRSSADTSASVPLMELRYFCWFHFLNRSLCSLSTI